MQRILLFSSVQVPECMKSDKHGRDNRVLYLCILASWVYLWSFPNHITNPKNGYTTKSIFWVSAYYTTLSIYGVGETTQPGSRSPLVQVGCYRLDLCVGFTASWHLSAYWCDENINTSITRVCLKMRNFTLCKPLICLLGNRFVVGVTVNWVKRWVYPYILWVCNTDGK